MPPFHLELDLVLHFTPLMDQKGRGISVTRTLELPFPPYNGLSIYGKAIDECPEPMGFRLKEVVWDIDRQVFLGKTTLLCDTPMALIADDIGEWLHRGWRMGSYLDAYRLEDEWDTDEKEEVSDGVTESDEDDFETWPTLPPRKRPKHFNALFRAILRKMADLQNNCAVAYAMWKTQRYFDDWDEPQKERSPHELKFRDAARAYNSMSIDEQLAWIKRVKKNYPRLDRLIT